MIYTVEQHTTTPSGAVWITSKAEAGEVDEWREERTKDALPIGTRYYIIETEHQIIHVHKSRRVVT